MKIIIIGAGIHGLTSGIELAKAGYDVTILDKNKEIFQGTSGATHNRAHLGYHYPRSIVTAKECIKGLYNFSEKYPEAIEDKFQSFYMIEKSGNVSLKEYENFCKEINIPFNNAWPQEEFLNRELLEGGTLTCEPIFDINKLRIILLKEVEKYNIKLILSAELVDFEKGNDTYLLMYKTDEKTFTGIYADIIINATYAYYNNILKILDLEEDYKKYKIQYTEVIVVESDIELPSITIMDGPFCSIMRYAGMPNKYLLYDVKNSTLFQEENYFVRDLDLQSNFKKIIDHFSKYFPFIRDLKFVESWKGIRPVPVEITDDARNTQILAHKKYPGIYSIQEGKFISATLIADQIVEMI